MVTTSIDDHAMSRPGLGPRFRSAVRGPEQRLVDAFLEATTTQLGGGRRLTVFAQPALDTGFPDIVGVVWRHDVARTWPIERERLRAADLRILHLLATSGATELKSLRAFFARDLHAMLTRLEESGVVTIGRSKCRARTTSRIFAVERIVAIEAKVSGARRAIEQASSNTWYSSESHVLLPTPRTGERLKDAAAALGLGIIALDHDRPSQVHKPTVRRVPLSYGSWLFNEWTWRAARRAG